MNEKKMMLTKSCKHHFLFSDVPVLHFLALTGNAFSRHAQELHFRPSMSFAVAVWRASRTCPPRKIVTCDTIA